MLACTAVAGGRKSSLQQTNAVPGTFHDCIGLRRIGLHGGLKYKKPFCTTV